MASAPPLLANGFSATLGGETVAFAEVTGLMFEREQSTYKHGLSEWEGETLQTYRSTKHQRLSLKRGVFAADSRFFSWLTTDNADARPLDIALVDPTGAPVLVWRIRRAIPVKLAGPSLNATSSEVAFNTLDVMATGITVERP
jgi:phage tail-like protein